MNTKRVVPGKAEKNTDVSEEPVAVPVRREHDSNQDAADQPQSDTISEHDGYKGFLCIKCQHCGEIKSFCSKKIIKSDTAKNMNHATMDASSGFG